MPETYLYRHRVTDDESDELRHANNVAYLEWMQEAAVAHSSASGWPPARYLELGFGWLVRRHVIEYLQPAFPGDQIVVKTWVASMDRVSCVRKYEITRDVDEVRLVNAWTDGRSASRTKEAAAEGDGRWERRRLACDAQSILHRRRDAC
ncbi:MAG: acyl-CoA thioesterase, partial [Acidobacteria bacterium]